jgi:ectoine hydroxylase-related dioxygenase (phytanoyl-CoA dioxygenase family)
MENSYGVTLQQKNISAIDFHLEELRIKGFTVLPDVLDEQLLDAARQKLDAVYATQADAFGEDRLASIHEKDLARMPLKYDEFFLNNVAANPRLIDFMKEVLGDYFILHLQNGIINRPNEVHHQSSWHRDLPYQNFVISKPLAIGALFCIDEFTVENGCTQVVPFTHKCETIPSAEYINANKVHAVAKAGSVIVFDAMLFHKAGYNSSANTRRGINNVYITPILKQQIDMPKALNGRYADDDFLRRFLGYDAAVAESDVIWREKRVEKNNK